MTEPVIASLAILKVNADQGRDYIENFVPFAAQCLRDVGQSHVTVSEIRSCISRDFGLTIPRGALETIMGRVVRKGYATQQAGAYYPDAEALAAVDVSRMRADFLRRLEALVAKLVWFCDTRYHLTWSQGQGEAALLSYLRERATPILATAVDGEPLPPPQHRAEHSIFLISRFIAHLAAQDAEGFELLETVVKGTMLVNALFFPELARVTRRFDRVEVYFDTGFLLRALGYADAELQAPHRELMDLLYELSGELRCFEHTVHEVEGILHAAARALRDKTLLRSAYFEALEYFVQSNYRPSDVDFLIARLRQSLSRLRVRIKAKPRHEERLEVDEPELQRILHQRVGYRAERTLRHDLDCLTAIHRLRRGEPAYDIESCRAIFVTTNRALARAPQAFFQEYGSGAVPLCLSDDVFTTIVWLKQPLRAPDLPRKKIIADCYAALNPSDALWRLCLEEMDRLQRRGDISESDYDLVRFSTATRPLIMDATFGDPSLCSAVSVGQLVEEARRAARAETEARLDAETARRMAVEQDLLEAVQSMERMRTMQADRCHVWALRAGCWAARGFLIAGIVVISLGIYSGIGLPFPGLSSGSRALVALALSALVGILTLGSLIRGTTLRSLARRVELGVAGRAEAWFKHILIAD
jgi:hypothetical protein